MAVSFPLERFSSIQGWLAEDEARLLFRLCEPPWCEVGSWKGRSTVVLASKGPGFAVDWFHGSQEHEEHDWLPTRREFLDNTRGLPVTLVEGRFGDVHSRVPRVNFLFLDAEHTYEATKEAFGLYSPKLNPRKFLVIHDALGGGWLDVEKFRKELERDPFWRLTEIVHTSAVFQKL